MSILGTRDRMSRQDWCGVAAFALIAVAFAGIVELRSAFLSRRRTDFEVYARAAWAARTGADLYSITDSNGWHYCYPPLYAVLMAPFADPPPGADRSGTMPFAVSVGIWYFLSLGFTALAIHRLATALERTGANSPDPPSPRRWWLLRMLPLWIGLSALGCTLVRGQVNLLLMLLLCLMMAAAARGRSVQAGMWLAGAICIKVIPAYLLVYPVWRRDWRWLASCAGGLVLGLVVVPAAVMGPRQATQATVAWVNALARPALTDDGDKTRSKELLEMTATDNQSFQALIHNWSHPDLATRPAQPEPGTKLAHWIIGGAMTLATLAAGGRAPRTENRGMTAEARGPVRFRRYRRLTLVLRPRFRTDPVGIVLTLGALTVVMLPLSPVCHLHYFVLALPLIVGLIFADWQRNGAPVIGWRLAAVLGLYVVSGTLPMLPGIELYRDFGPAAFGNLIVWVAGVSELARRPATTEVRPQPRTVAA